MATLTAPSFMVLRTEAEGTCCDAPFNGTGDELIQNTPNYRHASYGVANVIGVSQLGQWYVSSERGFICSVTGKGHQLRRAPS